MLSPKNRNLPPPLPGFEKIYRYRGTNPVGIIAKIKPGEYYLARKGEAITTVLGSCVAACIRDPQVSVGGMNHFMLPRGGEDSKSIANDALRYGNFAMEHLINDVIKYGGKRANLEIKLFGGANLAGMRQNVGERNVAFILDYLQTEGLCVSSQDMGGNYPRKILFFPDSGKVLLKKVEKQSTAPVVQEERKMVQEISRDPVQGEVELFI